VELRVTKGIPEGAGRTLKKRIEVSYGGGLSLKVKVDGAIVLEIARLFDRVTPDDCSWSLGVGKEGKAELVITMEKADPRPWSTIELPGMSL
jgi:hypothetical protein